FTGFSAYPGIVSSFASMTTCSTPSEAPNVRAPSRSSAGAVGDAVVSAMQRAPRTSCATRRRNVESTPPENATSVPGMGASVARRLASFAPSSTSATCPILDALGLEQVRGEVALARVREDGQHDAAAPKAARDGDGRRACRAGGDPDQEPFVARERACELH